MIVSVSAPPYLWNYYQLIQNEQLLLKLIMKDSSDPIRGIHGDQTIIFGLRDQHLTTSLPCLNNCGRRGLYDETHTQCTSQGSDERKAFPYWVSPNKVSCLVSKGSTQKFRILRQTEWKPQPFYPHTFSIAFCAKKTQTNKKKHPCECSQWAKAKV